jgi:hypothetical protein
MIEDIPPPGVTDEDNRLADSCMVRDVLPQSDYIFWLLAEHRGLNFPRKHSLLCPPPSLGIPLGSQTLE